jgi:hypothetical protein
MPRNDASKPQRRNFDPMDEDIEAFYATIPDGEYPLSEIQKMKPHPLKVSVEARPGKQQTKQRFFQGKAMEPVPLKTPSSPNIESHDASEVKMIFEGGKLVAFRYPDGSRRKVTRLHTEED